MCGIAGLVLRDGETVESSQLRMMATAMAHRGPDAEGIHLCQNFGLSFRRLKIIDLSDTANQPMFNEDGKVVIVFNGEIYNFMELRSELERAGHQFKTRSDTEVVVHAYEEWGKDAFRRFNGMFGIGVIDTRAKMPVLFLARDRFGIKPLFYAYHQGRLAFASELKPLLKVDWISKRVSAETLLYFLKFSHVPTPRSILDGVQQLEPGTWLRLENGQIETGVYFDTREIAQLAIGDARGNLIHSEEEALSELEGTLKRVVARQIVSDVPVGCFLSGGIDSSLLTVAYASLEENQGRPIKTFTIGYREKEFDEASFANEIASIFKTEHYELILKPSDLFDQIHNLPVYFDQPFADPTSLPTLLLAKFAKEKVTVALSGDGGDELFFGYPHQRALLSFDWLTSVPLSLRKAVFGSMGGMIRAFQKGPFNRKETHQLLKFLDILQFSDRGQFYQNWVGTIGPLRMQCLSQLMVEPVNLSRSLYAGLLERLAELPLEERVAQVFLKTFLLDTVLAKTDRAGMAVGLEARVPLLDNEIADFSARVPFHFKYKKGTSKYLLRKLLERKLSERGVSAALSRRKKQGFSIPMREWLRGELKFLLQEYLGTERLRREGIFRAESIRRLVEEHVESRANHSHLLWSLIMFEMWKERYSL